MLNLILVHSFHFFFAFKEMIVSVVVFDLLVIDFLSEFSNFLVLSIKFSLDSGFLVLLDDFNLVFEMLDVSLEFISLLLFDQDFFGWNDLVAEFFILLVWIFIRNLESTEDTILTS